MQRKDWIPFPPQFLSVSLWEPQALLGWNSQQKEALLYLFICPGQFALLCTDPCPLPRRLLPAVCALAFHWHTPSCHKNASRLNKERVCSERFGIPVERFLQSKPQRPGEEVGEWLESNTSCKGLKNCQRERNYQCYTTAGIVKAKTSSLILKLFIVDSVF